MSDSAVRPAPDEEWEDLMHQLRQRPQALPRPFFYPRVRARLAAETAAESPTLPGWLRRPAYAVLCGAVVLALSGDGAAVRSAAGTPRGGIGLDGPPPRLLPRYWLKNLVLSVLFSKKQLLLYDSIPPAPDR